MESIYTYHDYRNYLRDYYEQCNSRNGRFSLRSFALKTGLNVSNLTRILKSERNISDATAERLIVCMKLREREAEYFRLLVKYNQAKNNIDKQTLFDRIRTFRKIRLKSLDAGYDEYFANWYTVALRELVNILPGKLSTAEMAQMMVPSPKPNDIRKSYHLLLKLGLIKENSHGVPELSDSFVSTMDEWTSTTIHSFQVAMAELGKQALDRFPKKDRAINTYTLSLSKEGYDKAVEVLKKAQQEITGIAGADDDPDRIYELNIQLFPLSRPNKEQE